MLEVSGTRGELLSTYGQIATHPYGQILDLVQGWFPMFPWQRYIFGSIFDPLEAPVLESLGFGTTDDLISIQVRGYPPRPEPYRSGKDGWLFGIGHPHGWSFPTKPKPRLQHEVFHLTYEGRAISSSSDPAFLMGSLTDGDVVDGINLPKRYTPDDAHRKMRFNGSWSVSPTYDDGFRISHFDEVLSVLKNAGELRVINTFIPYPTMLLTNVIDEFHNDAGIRYISFSGELRRYPYGTNPGHYPKWWSIPYKWDVTMWPQGLPHQQFFGVHMDYPVPNWGDMYHTVTLGPLSGVNTGTSLPDQGFIDLADKSATTKVEVKRVIFALYNEPGDLVKLVDNGFDTVYQIKSIGMIEQFHDEILDVLPDITAGLFYSSSDAIEKHVSVIEANNVENLAQLGGILSVVPDAAKFLQAIAFARNGDLLNSGYTMVDLLTEMELQKDFGFSPNKKDLEEFAEKYDSIVSQSRRDGTWGEKTLYGKFDFTFPEGSFHRQETHCTFKSMVRTSFAHTSLLGTALDLKSIGLLPSMSSLWEVIPFTFVADWAFNIKDRLHDVENAAFLLCLPCHGCTHTLTFTSPLTESEMDRLGLKPTGKPGESPALRIFFRFPSLRFPMLRDGRFDYRSANGPRSVVTAGSLAFQLMKL